MGLSRYVDGNEYFDQLLSNIFEYQHLGNFCILGDFNARIADMADCIEGVDQIPGREILHFKKNAYGDLFCEFLINSNCFILNGRQSKKNDFTSISVKGMSVVDYIVVPYEDLYLYTDFEVIRVSDLPNVGVETKLMPDHSLLSCIMPLKLCDENRWLDRNCLLLQKKVVKFDTCDIPVNFCNNDAFKSNMNDKIRLFESDMRHQDIVDVFYESLSGKIKDEMLQKLPKKEINVVFGKSKKRNRVLKPWWTDDLQILWNNMCAAEKHGVKMLTNQILNVYLYLIGKFLMEIYKKSKENTGLNLKSAYSRCGRK